MKKEEKKLKVLKAASECFARFGYDKTTLEDIGRAVGLNKASLYYYYKNKESIFCDVILREADVYLQDLQKKVRTSRTSEARILTYLTERLNYYRMVVNLHNLSLDTVRKVEPVFYETFGLVLKKETQYLAGLIKEGQESGEFGKSDAQKVADALMEIAISIRYREVHMSIVRMADEADYDRINEDIRFTAKLILRGLKAA